MIMTILPRTQWLGKKERLVQKFCTGKKLSVGNWHAFPKQRRFGNQKIFQAFYDNSLDGKKGWVDIYYLS